MHEKVSKLWDRGRPRPYLQGASPYVGKARQRLRSEPEVDQGGGIGRGITHISNAHVKDRTIINGKIARTCCFVHNWYGFAITERANAMSRPVHSPRPRGRTRNVPP